MAKITKVKLNSKGFMLLLKSNELKAELESRGTAIEAALPTADGEDWKSRTTYTKDRVGVIIGTGNEAAKKAAADNALQQALNAGR